MLTDWLHPHCSLFAINKFHHSPQAPMTQSNRSTSISEKFQATPCPLFCAYAFFTWSTFPSFGRHPISLSWRDNAEDLSLVSLELPWFIFLLLVSWQWVLEGTGQHIFLCICLFNVCFPPPNSMKAGTTSTVFTSVSPMPSSRPASVGTALSWLT